MPVSISEVKKCASVFSDTSFHNKSHVPPPAEPSLPTEDYFSVGAINYQVPESFALREECATNPVRGIRTKTHKNSINSTYTFSDGITLRGTEAGSLERFGLASSNIFKVNKPSSYSWKPLQARDEFRKDSVSHNMAKVVDYAQQGAILLEKSYFSSVGQLAIRLFEKKGREDPGDGADAAYVNHHIKTFAAFLNQSCLLSSNTLQIDDLTADPRCSTGSARSMLFGSTSAIFNYFGNQEGLTLLPLTGSIASCQAKRGDRIKLLKSHFCTASTACKALSEVLPDVRDVAVRVDIYSKAVSLRFDSRTEENGSAISYSYKQNTTTSEIYVKAVSTKTGKDLLLFPIMAAKEVIFTDIRTGNQQNFCEIRSLPWQAMKQIIPHSTFVRHGLADFKIRK